MLKKAIKQHKRIFFDGDNYSEEWHAEAARRGLPNLRDSVEAFQVLKARKNLELFKKYGVLGKAEYESRIHIAIEKYVKQLAIEAETMVSIARGQILPAALEHQRRMAEAVAATKAAGLEAGDTTGRVARVHRAGGSVPRARPTRSSASRRITRPTRAGMPRRSARQLKPAMARLRETGDAIQSLVAADLWPLPTYRDLLFLK